MRAYLSGIVAALLAFGAALIYAKGRKDAYDADQLEDHNEYIATRKRMDAVDDSGDDDEWLRERANRGKRGGGL